MLSRESFVPLRVYRFTEFEVFRSSIVPFTAHEQEDYSPGGNQLANQT